MKKFKKWQIITATGAAIAVVGMGSWLAFGKSGDRKSVV